MASADELRCAIANCSAVEWRGGAEKSTQNNGAAHALAERYSCSMPRCVSSSDMDELNGVRHCVSRSDMDELNGVRMTAHATWHA